jgi:palmitoyl-protein thioesterase
MLKLENLVLVKFNHDSMVVPKDSEWFGFYKEGQAKEIYSLEESKLYINDTLGLQTLEKSGIISHSN